MTIDKKNSELRKEIEKSKKQYKYNEYKDYEVLEAQLKGREEVIEEVKKLILKARERGEYKHLLKDLEELKEWNQQIQN